MTYNKKQDNFIHPVYLADPVYFIFFFFKILFKHCYFLAGAAVYFSLRTLRPLLSLRFNYSYYVVILFCVYKLWLLT